MQTMGPIDIFATKGIEYLLVIIFLVMLVVYWRVLNWTMRPAVETIPGHVPETGGRVGRRPGNAWFEAPPGYFFHQGHAWARPDREGVVTVGLDDFAQQLVGEPAEIELPPVGARLQQGEPAWKLHTGPRSVRMISPVDGEVVERNPVVLDRPAVVNQEPYGAGWLMKVRVPNADGVHRNLLSGNIVSAWLDDATERLRTMWTRELGTVLPDGGAPVPGFAREMSPEHWDEVAEEFLLSR